MAQPSEVEEVRQLTNETDDDTFSDGDISDLVDRLGGVHNAAADIWRKKAAAYSDLTDTSEGGASRALSKLSTNALAMAKDMDGLAAKDNGAANPNLNAPRVTKIVRST